MFSSIWGSSAPADPTAPTFHPVTARYDVEKHPELLYGELEPKDTEWLCAGGFVTETQIFYQIMDDGKFFWCQVIHSSIGVWYPTIQFTCKIYDPKTGERVWKSVNVSNFTPAPPGTTDKRSSKADEFSITHSSSPSSAIKPPANASYTYSESYTIRCNLGTDLQVSVTVARPSTCPGFKVGSGPQGGYSYFGSSIDKPDGNVIHRFWPLTHFEGHIVRNGQAEMVNGKGVFIHAIQGMRPNLIAASWNFGWFVDQASGEETGAGNVAVQMEFKTIEAYGMKGAGSGGVSVSVGAVVVDGHLATVVGETRLPGAAKLAAATAPGGVTCGVEHLEPVPDSETGYNVPSSIRYNWSGPAIAGGEKVSAELGVDFGKDAKNVKGLMEKVDVLAEIPSVLKMAVNYVAGTKPYIYQTINPATLKVTTGENARQVKGTLYNESTFIS